MLVDTTPLTIAFVPGVTLTKWTQRWAERHPGTPLAFVPIDAASGVSVLREARADVAFVRLPIDRAGLNVIALYDETPVVVVPKDHAIDALESVTLSDLAGGDLVAGTLSPEDAVELVAAGGGIVLLPHSLARLHARKDVVARPVTDAAETTVAIVWLEAQTTSEIEEFVGIVRGRTAASSRAVPTPKTEKPRKKVVARAQSRSRPRKPRGR